MRFAFTLPALLIALFLVPVRESCATDPQAEPDRAGIEFFEQKIRPALEKHCTACHSADAARNKKLKGNLRLDSRADTLRGGDSGPALVPGKPAESLLLKSLKYDGDIQMPPKGKLPDAVIRDFENWIARGAPDPRTGAPGPKRQVGLSIEAGRKFWAYAPPVRAALPDVRGHKAEVRNEIDAFVLAKLEAKGLEPAPEADRAILLRRLSFDLTGLPPTPEEVDEFFVDKDTDAYEKRVDRLLASPRFGERWGRHWLDVARFAESVTLRGFVFKEAWRYRDYVIDAFNSDLPFDRFIREQLAGDLLPSTDRADRARKLTATTFLQLGNTNLEEQDKAQLRMDVVDEQLDVIAKGFLAQTVTCARCHDHKFDPIPTRDYYALAGILRNARSLEHANVSKWIEVPFPQAPDAEAALDKHERAVAALRSRVAAARAKNGNRNGPLAVKDVNGIVVDDIRAKKVGQWTASTFNKTYIGDGYIHDGDEKKGEKTLTFQPENVPPGKYEVRLAYSSGSNRAERVPVHVFSADGEATVFVNMKKEPPIEGRYISLGEHRFEKGGQAYVIVSNEGTKGHVCPDAVVFVAHDKPAPIKEDAPVKKGPADELRALEAELKALIDRGPKRELVMSVTEEPAIEDTRINVRGNVHNLGAVAPRGFLTVALHGPVPALPKNQSGRAELAAWIASESNPLTARVIVNRAWHWLFGAGLVRTVDNFGTTGERPTHPELLDYLALKFQSPPDREVGGMGWSVKKLVRTIVLSRTYRQSTACATATVQADPENRLLGRANRRRLEAECLRDTLLMVGGRLDLERGGPTFPPTLAADYGYKSASNRRSVYLPQFRNALPEMIEVFDGADPSTVTGARNSGTVAPQALFMLNHPFVDEQSRHAAARLLADKRAGTDRIARAYRLTLGREPTAGERAVAERFLKGKNETDGWTAVFHALFASAEFRYVP